MRKSHFLYTLFVLSLIGILGFSYISERSPVTNCNTWESRAAKGEKYYIHPEKIVVQPWRGEHHVFAMFMIPGGYLNDKLFTVTIEENETICGILAFAGTSFAEGVYAKPGYYLMKALFNTRTALWLIVQGKGEQLQQPLNWTLGYSKIENKK
ncbi:MAG: hypothetical protein ACHBN1_24940 [Heteroscytonema crispum UTEX LB 1556]